MVGSTYSRRRKRRLLKRLAIAFAGVALALPAAVLADSGGYLGEPKDDFSSFSEAAAPIVSEKFVDGSPFVPVTDDKVIVAVPTVIPRFDDKVIVAPPTVVPRHDDKLIIHTPAAALDPDSRALRPGPHVDGRRWADFARQPDGSRPGPIATGDDGIGWRGAGIASAFTLAFALITSATALAIRRRRTSVAL